MIEICIIDLWKYKPGVLVNTVCRPWHIWQQHSESKNCQEEVWKNMSYPADCGASKERRTHLWQGSALWSAPPGWEHTLKVLSSSPQTWWLLGDSSELQQCTVTRTHTNRNSSKEQRNETKAERSNHADWIPHCSDILMIKLATNNC